MALLRTCRALGLRLSQQWGSETAAIGVRASSSESMSTANVPVKQPEPESSKSEHTTAGEEWTEVIDEKSGQPYYWNQKTGETTQLGEPKPKTKFNNQDWQQHATSSSGPFQDGWREPPGRDLTYFYSMLGTAIGIAVGWVTQYSH